MGSLQSRAIGTAGRILQFAQVREDNFHVIASEAKQSSFCTDGMDCFVALLLAMTGEGSVTASSHPSEYSSTLRISKIQ
jgi:hypothetical protein